MKKQKVLIIGAGGHSKVVIDSIDNNQYEVVGALDKDEHNIGKKILGVPIIGIDADSNKFYEQGIKCAVIGIGHLGNFELRNKIFFDLKKMGFYIINVIHPSAAVSKEARLGEGNVVFPNTTINAAANIGDNNIINTGAIVEHDVSIGNNVHMAPGSVVCGMSSIGDNAFIGAGSILIQGITIGKNVVVGAGSTVLNTVEDNIYICGTPAKCIKRR